MSNADDMNSGKDLHAAVPSSRKFSRIPTALGVMSAVLAMEAAPALAQRAVEEIIVTARKRTENLQEIPLAITAFTADTLERKGLNNLEDVVRLTPGMQFDQGTFPQDIRVVLRGLSPTQGRPNVAILLDGVDVSSESVQSAGGSLLINPRLFDMARIEIVKGPQSALYGRSAFAGAINYITKKPSNEWERSVSLQAGQRNDFEGRVSMFGPITEDKVFIGLNASAWNFDGYYDNATTGADLGDNDGFGTSATLVFKPSDDVSFTTRTEYSDDHIGQAPITFRGSNNVAVIPATALGWAISPAVPTITQWKGAVPDAGQLPAPRISADPATGKEYRGSDRKIFRIAGTLEWDMDWGALTSLTHYASANLRQAVENTRQGSFNALNFGTLFKNRGKTKLFSQELRLQSEDDARLRWMFGGLYWKEKVNQDSFNLSCINNQVLPNLPFLPCGPFFTALTSAAPDKWVRDTEHWSVFGMLEYNVTDQLVLHAEARYAGEDLFVSGPSAGRTIDAFGLAGRPTTAPPASPVIGAGRRDHFISPRFSLEYKATDDALLYASVAKGEKPRGISTSGAGAGGFDPDLFAYEPERMWVYEVGTKSTWADGSVVANLAVYYEDFAGKQTTSQILRSNGLLGTLIVNASSAEVKGLEFDTAWAATENLNLTLGYALADSKYNDFIVNTGGAATIGAIGNCTRVTVGTTRLCAVDRSGNELEDVAKHSLTVGASYTAPISGDMNWLIETDVKYQDSRFDTSENILSTPSYWLTDLRIGVTSDAWRVVAFANNLFDDDTVKNAFNATDFSTIRLAFFPPPFTFVLNNGLQAVLPPKRQIGVRASYKF